MLCCGVEAPSNVTEPASTTNSVWLAAPQRAAACVLLPLTSVCNGCKLVTALPQASADAAAMLRGDEVMKIAVRRLFKARHLALQTASPDPKMPVTSGPPRLTTLQTHFLQKEYRRNTRL